MALRLLFTIIFIIFFHGMCSSIAPSSARQKQPKGQSKILWEHYKSVYSSAIDIEDTTTAILALNSALEIVPEDSITCYTLLNLYFNSGKYNSCLYLAKRAIKGNPQNILATYFIAKSAESTHRYSEALTYYEKLYYLTNDIYYTYPVANLQYTLFRYYEANIYIQNLLKHKEIDTRNVMVNVEGEQPQEVNLRAVLLNLRGLVLIELKDKVQALQSFEQALTIYPNFILAKKNIDFFKSK